MNYLSTRAPDLRVSLSEAVLRGMAPDGGLYVPESFPKASLKAGAGIAELASGLLAPFFEGDPLAPHLARIAREALNFPIPLKKLGGGTALLELFHGPTAAFKDVGARFLAGLMSEIPSPAKRTILVATSGDTGGAVASAFYRKPGVDVAVLFPAGGVSKLQERQLTCWGENVTSFKVRGTFDDCQKLVKAAFAARGTEGAIAGRELTSANSINVGRLLPQMLYYAKASLEYEASTGQAPGFIIPTGNMGNAMAAIWAMILGLPIREIIMATNANRVIFDYFESGFFRPRPSVPTLANAMDVGNPSNMERLIGFAGRDPAIKGRLRAHPASDEQIRQAINVGLSRYGKVWCPHTAAAVHVRELQNSPHWIIVATAHPAKFADVVEPLIGRKLELPPQLQALLDQPQRFTEIEADLEELRRRLAA